MKAILDGQDMRSRIKKAQARHGLVMPLEEEEHNIVTI